MFFSFETSAPGSAEIMLFHIGLHYAVSKPPFQCGLLREWRGHSANIARNRRLAAPTFASDRSRFYGKTQHFARHLAFSHILSDFTIQLTSHVIDFTIQLTSHVIDFTIQLTSHVIDFTIQLTSHVIDFTIQSHLFCTVRNSEVSSKLPLMNRDAWFWGAFDS